MKGTLAFELASAQRSRDSVNLGADVGTSWTGSARRVWKLHSGYAANCRKILLLKRIMQRWA